MMAKRFSPLFSAILASAIFALSLGTGCNSTAERDNAIIEANAKVERPVAMKGADDFFDGKVVATVTVSRGFGRTGLGGRKSRGMERTDSMADISGMEDEEAMAYLRGRAAMGSPMPSVTIRLKLENKSKEPLDVEILEVNSDLGNFAVRPAKLALPAEQTAEPEPMFSQLGVTSDEIPVKVRLRTDGKTETKTVMVKVIHQPAPPK